ncbi:hypothetical protein PAMC26510_03620 [Caballeronia sordidicola]|uniref:Uncharacterized protein n=1 Tax=Caballeronia sordidicola TaxID=196367 RepID=A0A242MYQ2_CABSO|nr:hypothetical protein PAMC26577_11160 [Caballeronia sordidicola]OTP80202.1 hypothetical protein PAMC26510_03620 [Caballeronia sordidicola]
MRVFISKECWTRGCSSRCDCAGDFMTRLRLLLSLHEAFGITRGSWNCRLAVIGF